MSLSNFECSLIASSSDAYIGDRKVGPAGGRLELDGRISLRVVNASHQTTTAQRAARWNSGCLNISFNLEFFDR
jgi:hypothetical protein